MFVVKVSGACFAVVCNYLSWSVVAVMCDVAVLAAELAIASLLVCYEVRGRLEVPCGL